jgi:Na+/alanine symporter
MVVEYIPDFSTVIETDHCAGNESVGPGIMEAFVVGTGVGGVVGSVVGTVVGVGVTTGLSGDEQPATIRSMASTSARARRGRECMKGIFFRSI